jgi:hypothetical protein
MATNLNTPTLPEMSRRKFAKSAVALVSAAGLSAAGGALAHASNSDAELLDLGRQLAALFDEYSIASDHCEVANAAWVVPPAAEALKATRQDLLTIGNPETEGGYWTNWAIKEKMKKWQNDPAIMMRLNELLRLAEEQEAAFWRSRIECGMEAAAEAQNEVCTQIEALTARIRALPATTFQGLAVKALHLTFDTSLFDEEPEDMDWDQFCLRGFATEVLRHLPDDIQCRRSTEALAA